jgi:hypothetical protein
MRYQFILLFFAGVFLLSQVYPAYPLDSAMPENEAKQELQEKKQEDDYRYHRFKIGSTQRNRRMVSVYPKSRWKSAG